MSVFELASRYSSLLRRISYIHPKIITKFQNIINTIKIEIEKKIESNNEQDVINLLFKLENILDTSVIEEYNSIISNSSKFVENIEVVSDNEDLIEQEQEEELVVSNVSNKNIPDNVWTEIMSYLEKNLNIHTFNVWVKPTKYIETTDTGEIKIKVENGYYKNFLEEHCSSLIRKYIDERDDLDCKVSFVA